jgi:hypothetical protein
VTAGIKPAELEEAELAFRASRRAPEETLPEEEDGKEELPFFRSHQAPAPSDQAKEPFLRSAPTALDTHTETRTEDATEPAPAEQDERPVGPVRTAALREALASAGGMESAVLADIATRMKDL